MKTAAYCAASRSLSVPRSRLARSVFTAALMVWGMHATPARAAAYTFQGIVDPANVTFTQLLGINGAGTIVGYGNATNFDGFQLVVPNTFTRENFPNSTPPPATFFTQVFGINAAGNTTVGFYVDTAGLNHGFANTGGTFATIDRPGTAFNQLLGINQNGNEIAGYSSTDPAGATLQHAFSLVTGTTNYTDINALLPANTNSQATGVNNSGEVVGFWQNAAGDFSAFTDIGGSITSFEFPGSMSTQALGVNDLGEIVGDYVDAGGMMHGFLDNAGMFSTLDPTGSTATTINGIGDNGTVVGFFVDAAGNTIGTVGTPTTTAVPEPSTLALLTAGLFSLGGLARRRRVR